MSATGKRERMNHRSGSDRASGQTREHGRGRVGPVLAVACLVFAGLSGATAVGAEASPATAAVAGASSSIVYPYACTATFAGGASYTDSSAQVNITDLLNAPGVRSYPGGSVMAQLQVAIPLSSATVTALIATGTTDWTSTNARLVWGGVSSPATAFAWHVYDLPQFAERFPISFTTASFQLPRPRDIAPGALSWDFQANPGVQAGFESGHVQCAPVPPVQTYATLLPASGPSCAHDGRKWTCRFSYTGGTQLWQVPADVAQITVDARGASGAGAGPNIDIDKVWPGGRGGESVATLAVTPREHLIVTVGGSNGFNGGGAGNFANLSGGGASDVRSAPFGLSQRRVVAGGGGGGGLDVFCFSGCPDDSGGAGGGVTGIGAGGGPGTQTGGGAAQAPGDPYFPATSGWFGTGGAGASGGGGGYYGGGGATTFSGLAEVGGGGGGSGFVPPGPGNSTVAGRNSGDGSVSISYTSSTTPYTSRYTSGEARWLLIDLAALRSPDLASAQHDAAMFMPLLGALIRASGGTPPNLGSAPGAGPIVVTSTYTQAENASLKAAATLFRSDPPTLQHVGVAVLAFLIGLRGH